MSTPIMRPRSAPLRFIAVRLRVPDMENVIKQPGIGEAFRVTVQYHDGRFPDQVATLTRRQAMDPMLSIVYRRANDKALAYEHVIDTGRFQSLILMLRRIDFDRLDDAPDIPWYGADLWLVERVAGSFYHDVIIAPDSAVGVHAEIVQFVRDSLHEAIRTINV